MIITSLTPIHPHLPYSPLLTPVQYCSLGQTDPFSLSLPSANQCAHRPPHFSLGPADSSSPNLLQLFCSLFLSFSSLFSTTNLYNLYITTITLYSSVYCFGSFLILQSFPAHQFEQSSAPAPREAWLENDFKSQRHTHIHLQSFVWCCTPLASECLHIIIYIFLPIYK